MYIGIHVFFSGLIKLEVSKNLQILSFMKTRPVCAELFHMDRQTDRLIAWLSDWWTGRRTERQMDRKTGRK